MRKIFLLSLIFVISASYAYCGVTIDLKDQYGEHSSGSLKEATVIVKPQGIYSEYNAILTFSSYPSPYNSDSDTLEVTFTFNLDPNSCVTGLWLYQDDGKKVRADIYDRWSSQIVYNDLSKSYIIQAMLTKKSNGLYIMKTTRLVGNSVRKIGIDYFIPNININNYASVPFPGDWFASQKNFLDSLNMIYVPNKTFTKPIFPQDQTIQFEAIDDKELGACLYSKIPVKKITNYNSFYVESTIGKSDFFNMNTIGNKSYYQLSIHREAFKGNTEPMKLCVIIDYEKGKSNKTGEEILRAFATSLKKNYIVGDSFNIVISGFKPTLVSQTWIPIVSDTIDKIISKIDFKLLSETTHLFASVDTALGFINSHGDSASIYILSNSDAYGDRDVANEFIAHIFDKRKVNIPVNIFSYINQNWITYIIAGMRYTGNDYLYSNLIRMTRGAVFSKIYDNPDPVKGFDAVLPKIFGQYSNVSIYSTAQDGYTYDKYILSNSAMNGLDYTELGRIDGRLPFTIDFQYIFRNKHYNYQYKFDQSNIDTNKYKNNVTWACNYILNLEASDANYNNVYGIIDQSILHRVLSVYTAFYTKIDNNVNPEDPEDPTEVSDAFDISGATMSISPNPVVRSSAIKISIPEYLRKYTGDLSLYDLNGNLLKQFDYRSISSDGFASIYWDGTDSNGRQLPNGVYMLVLKIGSRVLSLKVVIAR